MKRGEIYYARLDPVVGSEMGKLRPVLIVSNNTNNNFNTTVTILPISSSVRRVYPFEVKLIAAESGLAKDSKILAQQIRTISKERVSSKRLANLDADLMVAVDLAIKRHLFLD